MFMCLECGKKFTTAKAAERAADKGCPGCGGVDIDLAAPCPGGVPVTLPEPCDVAAFCEEYGVGK